MWDYLQGKGAEITVPINVNSKREATVAKAFLMTKFSGDKWLLEQVHIAFDQPHNTPLMLSLREKGMMSAILADISGSKISIGELAWDGSAESIREAYSPKAITQTEKDARAVRRRLHVKQEVQHADSAISTEEVDGNDVR